MLIDFWDRFRDEFGRAVREGDPAALQRAWDTSTARTAWYCGDILRSVAAGLGYSMRTELFKVDAALCREEEGHSVPVVFVESENDATSAHHEMWKLCSLAAPLKVLITCVEWCDAPGYWARGGRKAELLERWSAIIRAHNRVWPQPCAYGVIVGERKGNRQRFYSVAFGAAGQIVDAERLLLDHEFPAIPNREMGPASADKVGQEC